MNQRLSNDEAEAIQAADYRQQFIASVTSGSDKLLPVFNVSSPARFARVSAFLGDCHKDAQALLLKACAAAQQGDAALAVELLKSFTDEVADEYGNTTAEAVMLIADCGREAA